MTLALNYYSGAGLGYVPLNGRKVYGALLNYAPFVGNWQGFGIPAPRNRGWYASGSARTAYGALGLRRL